LSSVTEVRVAEGPVAEGPGAERSDGEVSLTVETESVFRAGVLSDVAAGAVSVFVSDFVSVFVSDFEVTVGDLFSDVGEE
jgi:hypothetical protein